MTVEGPPPGEPSPARVSAAPLDAGCPPARCSRPLQASLALFGALLGPPPRSRGRRCPTCRRGPPPMGPPQIRPGMARAPAWRREGSRGVPACSGAATTGGGGRERWIRRRTGGGGRRRRPPAAAPREEEDRPGCLRGGGIRGGVAEAPPRRRVGGRAVELPCGSGGARWTTGWWAAGGGRWGGGRRIRRAPAWRREGAGTAAFGTWVGSVLSGGVSQVQRDLGGCRRGGKF
ncbi:hypothetical protein SETIT_8G246700v2 [Setaria italica]|uniref:Uncharacterized protein n=1 Tax=Setaria italica TaxID=4555 RepID=A0A368SD21_SETIT|nr:hypothetical protein SETIT_8G246700v2 [Setaria italica]